MDTQALLIWLTDASIYLANGALAVAYFLGERGPHLISVGVAVLLARTFDQLAQQEAMFAPERYTAGQAVSIRTLPRTAQVVTGVTLLLWLLATWSLGAPVPLIGAAMWAAGWGLLLVMPQQRWSLLWTMKGYLLLYSLTVIGFRVYLWQNAQLSPAQLAEVFGGAQSASQVLAQNTGTLRTLGAWLLWVIMPAGFFAIFLQNMIAQPMSLVGPFQGAQDVVAALRNRGAGEQGYIRSMGERGRRAGGSDGR
jgi:hypothetical protein